MSTTKLARFAVICTLAVAVTVGAACSSSGADGRVGQTDVSQTDTSHTVTSMSADDVMAAGVGVVALGCGVSASAGSGVVAGTQDHVVTVAHTVAGATEVTVVGADGAEHAARVVGFDPAADLAVLEVDDLGTAPLAVGDVALGDSTLVRWSVADGITAHPVDVTQRLAITIDDIYGRTSVRRSGFEFSGDVVVGDSGGPVVSADGLVIGIVYARSNSRASTGFATDATEIRAVLASVGTDPVDNGTCV